MNDIYCMDALESRWVHILDRTAPGNATEKNVQCKAYELIISRIFHLVLSGHS